MADKYTIKLEVEVEITAENKDIAVSFTDLLTLPEIRKVTGVTVCRVLEINESK